MKIACHDAFRVRLDLRNRFVSCHGSQCGDNITAFGWLEDSGLARRTLENWLVDTITVEKSIPLIDPRPGVLSERPSAIAAEDRSGQSRGSSSGRSGCK